MTHPPIVVQMDVSDLNTLPEKIAHIEQVFGHIDILINNAGISVRANVVSMAVDLDVQVMLVNYFGAVAVTKGNVNPNMDIHFKQCDFNLLIIIIYMFSCTPKND